MGTLEEIGGHTSLMIAAPEVDELVRPYRERYTESRGREPAHVTLLNPFLPEEEMDEEVEARIERAVGGFPAFEFQATEVTSFGWKGVYLAPEPVRLFVWLIQRLMGPSPRRNRTGRRTEGR